MNYLNDIVNKYRTCKKCGIQKQQLEMCLDVHKNKVDFDSGDWYCEKCYAELYKKQDGDKKKMKDEKIIAFVGGKGQTDLKEAIEVSLKPQMITHEEAIANLTSAARIDLDMHYKYIKQQEKKDELLELYKELSIVRFYLFGETDADIGQELMDKDDLLNKQIKALKEELK